MSNSLFKPRERFSIEVVVFINVRVLIYLYIIVYLLSALLYDYPRCLEKQAIILRTFLEYRRSIMKGKLNSYFELEN